MSTDTVRKSPAHLPETPTILRLLAEITGREPPAPAAPPVESPAVASKPGGVTAQESLGRVNWRNDPAGRTESQQRMNALDDPEVHANADALAGADALNADPQTGVTPNHAGAPVLTLSREFLAGLATALEAECGPTADAVSRSCGWAWGRRYAAHLEREIRQHLGAPLADRPLAEFTGCLAAAFNHHGWGLLTLDYRRSDRGLIVAELRYTPVAGPDGLLAGLLAGLFSHFAGLALDCILTQRTEDAARFVIGLPERLDRFADAAAQGRSHDEIVGELEATSA